MTGGFTYYILRYVHSQFLDERVNVGILFYFPHNGDVRFMYPSDFSRMKSLYEDFVEEQLINNIEAIENRVKAKGKIIGDGFGIEKILRPDSTVLQFSKPIISSNSDEENIAILNYYKLYFKQNTE